MIVIRGDRVRALRKAKRWSQKTLGQKAEVGQTTISDMETGKHDRPRGVLEVAAALETTDDYLLGLTDDPLPVQKLGAQPMQLDPPSSVTAKSHSGAIAGDAQENNTGLSTTSRILSIFGTSGGGAGKMSVTEERIDQAQAPGYAEHVANAYYVNICTSDMIPAYWPGDELLIYPEHPVYGGRDYLLFAPKVEGQPRMCKLRRIVGITDTHWVCIAWHPTQHEEQILIKEFPSAQWVEGKRNR